MNSIQILVFTSTFVRILGNLLTYAIIIRIVMSWFRMGKMTRPGQIEQFFNDVTNPVINLAKKLPHRIGMMDLSALVALIGIDIVVYVLQLFITKIAESL